MPNAKISKLAKLLTECRYYRGEASQPKDLDWNFVDFWIAEHAAVHAVIRGEENKFLSEYKAIGEPGKYTNILPILLASLFGYYCKGADKSPGDLIEPFEKKYLPSYLASTGRRRRRL